MQVSTPVERTLTQHDHVRLTRLLAQQATRLPGVEVMQEMLDTSDVVGGPSVPPTVVTMYSQVLLEDPAQPAAPYKLTLCFPDDAEPAAGFVSVLSPVGAALLGLRVGETAHWRTPGGNGSARILSVLFQPEASGDYQT